MKNGKQKLISAFMETYPEVTDLFYTILSIKNGNYDYKKVLTLAGYTEEQINKIDLAFPVDYGRSVSEIYPDFNNGRNVYDYNNEPFGELVNLNNKIVREIFKPIE